MYLVLHEVDFKENNVRTFSMVYFDSDTVKLFSCGLDKMEQIIQQCEDCGEVVNASLDVTGSVVLRHVSSKKIDVPDTTPYEPVMLAVEIEENSLWSILTRAITDNARLCVDGKYATIKDIVVNGIAEKLIINKEVYGVFGDNLIYFRYPEGSPAYEMYCHEANNTDDWFEISKDIKGLITFNLKKILFESNSLNILNLNREALKSKLIKYLEEYDNILDGFRFGAYLHRDPEYRDEIRFSNAELEKVAKGIKDKYDADNIPIMASNTVYALKSIDMPTFLQGVQDYILYAYDEIAKDYSDTFIYKAIIKEKLIVQTYKALL